MERVSLARICAHDTHRERESHAHTKPRTQFAWRIPSIPSIRTIFVNVYCGGAFFFRSLFFPVFIFLLISSFLDALISICEIIHPVWMNYASTAQVDRTSNGALSSRAPVHTIRRADFQPIGIRFFFLFFFSSFSLELMDLEDKYIQKTKKKKYFS